MRHCPPPPTTDLNMQQPILPHAASKTQWSSIALASVISCFTAVENTVLGVSEYAYLAEMDKKADAQFYGAASSLARFGHAVFAIVFSFWAYKTKRIREPLIFGRVLSLIACLAYLSVEHWPTKKRYLMGSCYFLFDIATSAPTVLRVYIIVVSRREDRPRAYAALTLANWIAVVIGPVFQLFFTSIRYPGIELFLGFRFHLYSAPVWLALFLNFVSIYLITKHLEDLPPTQDKPNFSFLLLVEKILTLHLLNVDWLLVGLCWILRVVANLSVVTLMALTSPLLMIVFGYTGEEATLANGISSSIVGFFALAVCSLFMFTKITEKTDPLCFFGISLLISLSMYTLSYPYPLISDSLAPFNNSTGAGCDQTTYPWCSTASSGYSLLFLALAAIQTGIGLPMAQISLDTVYSRVLKRVDQNILQGAFVAFEDLIYVIGPLYATSVFTYYGQSTLWIVNGLIEIGGILLFLVFTRKLL